MEVDVDIKNTGQNKMINGFDTRETILIITFRQKGQTVEQGGGMIVTTDMWLAPKIAAMSEVAAFDMRYAQKLDGGMVAGASVEEVAAAMAMYPMMKQAIGRMNVEGAKLDGTAILSSVTMDAVKSDADIANEAKQNQQTGQEPRPGLQGGVGGLLGGLAKKAAAKKVGGGDDAPKQRATIMTSTTEVLKVTTELSAADVAVPPGFKENR